MPFYVKLGSAYLNQEGTFTNRSLTTEGTKPFDTEEEALAAGIAAGAKENHLCVLVSKQRSDKQKKKPA